MTLWPISMFSRILAVESMAAPATQNGGKTPANSTSLQATLHRDDTVDVIGIGFPPVGDDFIAEFIHEIAECLEFISIQTRRVLMNCPKGGDGKSGVVGFTFDAESGSHGVPFRVPMRRRRTVRRRRSGRSPLRHFGSVRREDRGPIHC